jgi:hypothetical protein
MEDATTQTKQEAGPWGGMPDDAWSIDQALLEWFALASRPLTQSERDREFLMHLTRGEFQSDIGLRDYKHADEFIEVVTRVYQAHLGQPWNGPYHPWGDERVVERFMSSVMDACERVGLRYPKGWLLVTRKLRGRIKREISEQ